MRGSVDEETGEVTLYFDSRELDLAIYDCEFLAAMLESQRQPYDMSKLWDFARQLRGLREDKKL